MIIPICLIIGAFSGAALVFAAQEGILKDLIGAAFLAVLVAVLMAMALLLVGCSTGEFYDIPVDFGAYPETVTPLSLPDCSGQ